MNKPTNANYYNWDEFINYANEQGIQLDQEDDWLPWWEIWVKAQQVLLTELDGIL